MPIEVIKRLESKVKRNATTAAGVKFYYQAWILESEQDAEDQDITVENISDEISGGQEMPPNSDTTSNDLQNVYEDIVILEDNHSETQNLKEQNERASITDHFR